MRSVELSRAIKMKQKFQKESNRFQAYSKLFPEGPRGPPGMEFTLNSCNIGDKLAVVESRERREREFYLTPLEICIELVTRAAL